MVTSFPPVPDTPKVSKVEGIKERSNALREPVATEILQDTTHFTEDGIQILKFHGSYQQDNRDNRVKGQEKDYQFMLRTRNPGGLASSTLYRVLDELSEQYGNQTLRLTTRQGFQIHGVLKKNLKTVMAAIIRAMGTTLGACGDLNRNVMAPPAFYKNRPEYLYAQEYANRIADLLSPRTGAYYEIWLDGEKAITSEVNPEVESALQDNTHGTLFTDSEEPIYGTHYMPRKFKCAVTVPGDNSVDLFSQDVSLVVIVDEQGELQGFNVYAGGGLGRTHGKEETFARVADPIGYVDKADVYDLLKAIVATQRNYGDRTNRRHARMKYLLHDWGVEKFRATVEGYFGKAIQPMKSLPPFQYKDYLGWHDQGDGKRFLGISIQNGRIKDEESFRLKSALREIEQKFDLPMALTPSQDLVLYEIEPSQVAEIEAILTRCGIKGESEIDPLVRYSMACPALPTCGLAITESERAIPAILDRLRALLDKVGLEQDHFVTRMTGCPNGCARPYLAELGFVGQSPTAYQLWLGADPHQTRLSEIYLNNMAIDDLEQTLEPLFVLFKKERLSGDVPESFGDFCHRVGFDTLRQFAVTYAPGVDLAPPVVIEPDVPVIASETLMESDVLLIENETAMEPSVPVIESAPVAESVPVAESEAPSEPVESVAEPSVEPVAPPVEEVTAPGDVVTLVENTAPLAETGVVITTEEGTEEVVVDASAPAAKTPKPRHRLGVRDDVYAPLKEAAAQQGVSMTEIVNKAIAFYLESLKTNQES